MYKFNFFTLIFAVLLLFFQTFICSAQSQNAKLVRYEEVLSWQKDNQVVHILDVRKESKYLESHLPDAQQIERKDIQDTSLAYAGIRLSKEALARELSRRGVSSGDTIVLYGDRGNVDAARLWWLLQLYGHQNAFVLNGGVELYQTYLTAQKTKPLSTAKFTFPKKGNFDLLAEQKDVQQAINDPNILLVDTRTVEEYEGAILKKKAYRKGRIPTAINLDYSEAIAYEKNLLFREGKDLEQRFAHLDRSKKIIVYCQSGVRSAHMLFVLKELLGFQDVSNYDGSWIEWSYYTDLPIEKGPIAQLVEAKSYTQIAKDSYSGYWNYFVKEVTLQNPLPRNYFYGLIFVSLFFFLLELFRPWRPDQARFRKDFWLDTFYMFFNFFFFSLIIFYAASNIVSEAFNQCLEFLGVTNLIAIQLKALPVWTQLLLAFIIRDFIQWWVHRLLHRSEFLWEFHKVHHSVEQMGFAAHLRYHWMENVVYKSLEYLPLAMIGYGIDDFFIIHMFTVTVGHYNHANIRLPEWGTALAWGLIITLFLTLTNATVLPFYLLGAIVLPLALVLKPVWKYLFNSPEMHIWHHSYELPEDKPYGVNFGITLAIWDYIWGTNHIPHNGQNIRLGFPGIEDFPESFIEQSVHGVIPNKEKKNV